MACVMKKLEYAWNAVLIFHIKFCEHFLQQNGGYLLQKCTIFTGEKFPYISQGMKNT